MFPLPAFLAPSAVYARALNALLRREEWASNRLIPHSGKVLHFAAGRLQAQLQVTRDGFVRSADASAAANVTLTIPANRLSELPGILKTRDPARIASLMHIEGDAGLAALVSDLARDLRWDIEDDVARLVGDIAAARLAATGKLLFKETSQAASRLHGNVAEYLSQESGMVVSQSDYNDWQLDIDRLEYRLDALDARLRALSTGRSGAVRLGAHHV